MFLIRSVSLCAGNSRKIRKLRLENVFASVELKEESVTGIIPATAYGGKNYQVNIK